MQRPWIPLRNFPLMDGKPLLHPPTRPTGPAVCAAPEPRPSPCPNPARTAPEPRPNRLCTDPAPLPRQVSGEPAAEAGGVLWVSNHYSWLDYPVLQMASRRLLRVIARADMGAEGLFGVLALRVLRGVGVIEYQRGDKARPRRRRRRRPPKRSRISEP